MSAIAPMKWFKSLKFDNPALNSPQPCIHGAGCVYTVKDADGTVKPGCCRYVHPGEEGNGRRLFPETTMVKDGKQVQMPACVRLTGRAGFYERRRLHLSWEEWCARNNIAYTPNKVGIEREPAPHAPKPVAKPVTRATATATIKNLTEKLSVMVAASSLDDDGKALCNEEVTGIVEAVDNIFKRLEPSEDAVKDAEGSVKDAAALLKPFLESGVAGGRPFRRVTAADSARMMAKQREAADAEVSDEQYAKVLGVLASSGDVLVKTEAAAEAAFVAAMATTV